MRLNLKTACQSGMLERSESIPVASRLLKSSLYCASFDLTRLGES